MSEEKAWVYIVGSITVIVCALIGGVNSRCTQ